MISKALEEYVKTMYILKQNSNKSAYDERQWFVNKNIFKYYL